MKILLLAIGVIGLLCVLGACFNQPPLRGMVTVPGDNKPVLLSRARPAVSFVVAGDMRYQSSGWCSVHPKTSTNIDGDAKLWLALYGNKDGLLVTAVMDAENNWQWEPAHHPTFRPIRYLARPFGEDIRSLHEFVYALDHQYDPFCKNEEQSISSSPFGSKQSASTCLVYQAKVLLEFERVLVLYEYHEAIDAHLVPDLPHLDERVNAFVQRARAACRITPLDKATAQSLAENIEKMGTAPKSISRRTLARWTGDMRRKGEL